MANQDYRWVETKNPCGMCLMSWHGSIRVAGCDCICHRVNEVEVTIEGKQQIVKEK